MQNWSKSRVFVTGGTGLLGSHLVRELYARGADVICLARDSVPKAIFYQNDARWNLHQKVTIVRGDVRDEALIDRVLNDYEIDVVFHLAAQTIVGTAKRGPLDTFETNIQGTWNVLEACRRHPVKRIVVASSDKAYGSMTDANYVESNPVVGKFPYDVSKSCADLLAQSYFHSYGLPVIITRCGNLFGPGDLNFNRLIPGTIRSALRREPPVIRSDGTFIRDFIYVEDAARAYMSLAEAEIGLTAGEAFNISYENPLSVADVVNHVLAGMGAKDLSPDIQNAASLEIRSQSLSSEKIRRILQWKPEFGFDPGLQLTIDWYRWAKERARI